MPQITQGKHSYGRVEVIGDHPDAKITFGAFCQIGQDVKIILGPQHDVDMVSTYPFGERVGSLNHNLPHKGDVTVGNDVWIGHGATILGGVTIGDGAVIGAMSVVASDVDDYAVVIGNPARVFKHRFDYLMRTYYKKLKWWDLPDRVIDEMIKAGYFKDKP